MNRFRILVVTFGLLVPPAWPQAGTEVEAQLKALRKELDAAFAPAGTGGLDGINDRLKVICGEASALSQCEKWAIQTSDDFSADSRALQAMPGILNQLRDLTRQVHGAAFESADLDIELGEVYYTLADYKAAEPVYLRAVEALEKQSAESPGLATALSDLAMLYEQQGLYPKAESLDVRALEIRKKVLGPDNPVTAGSLNNLAELYATQGSNEKAEALYQQALAIFEKAAPDGPETATLLNNIAEWYQSQGVYPKAVSLYLRAIAILEKAAGPDSPSVAVPLDNLAGVYDQQGAYSKAEPLRLRALEIRKKALGPEHPDTAMSFHNLGTLYFNLGEYGKAEDAYRQALAIREKVLGPDHPDDAASLDDLAQVTVAQGAYGKAESLYLRALAIREKTLPAGHTDIARNLNGLAMLYYSQGEYAKAEPLFLRALAIREKALPPDHPDTADVLSSLALMYSAQGAYAKAEPLFLHVLAIREKVSGPAHSDTAAVVSNLAGMYLAQGEYARAEPLFVRALSIMEKALPAGHSEIAVSVNQLALLYSTEKEYAKAEPLFLRALEIQKKAWGLDHPETAATLSNLAGLYYAQKDYSKAETLYAGALATFERALGPDHPTTVSVQIDYARDLWQIEKRAEARDQMLAANRAVTGFWSHNLIAVEDARRRSLVQEFDRLTPLSLTMAAELSRQDTAGGTALAGLAISARKGIRSAAQQEVFAQIRRDKSPAALELFRQLVTNAERQGRLSRTSGAEADRDLQQLRQQENEIEKRLIDQSGSYRAWRKPADASEISAALPPASALIDVVRYPALNLATGNSGAAYYAAVVYRKGNESKFVSLGPAEPIDNAIGNLRSNFDNMWRTCAPADNCTGGAAKVLISGQQFQVNLDHTESDAALLYKLTFAKLRPALGGTKRLLISPDAKLAEIPWEILRDANGYLVEAGYRISYLDSARAVIDPPLPSEPRSPAVAIAQVDYDGRPLRAAAIPEDLDFVWEVEERPAGGPGLPTAGQWKPLNGGADILRTLRDLQQAGKIGPVEKLPLGSEEEVMALNQPAALFAHTHGFFRAGSQKAGLGGEGLDAGIILYGANRADDPDRRGHDGWLMAKEVMLLNLEGTQLVALLGCETGLGAEGGEGVQGLRHALTVAGARSTLLTLWEVGDLSAARFLRELLVRSAPDAGKTLEQAIAETQLAFLKGEVRESNSTASSNRWRHPYFWAAATLGGPGGHLNLGPVK